MSNIFKNIFGLEISNTSLTAVELAHGKSGFRVVNYSMVSLEPGIVEDDCIIVNIEGFKEALKTVLLEAKNGPITSKNVIISIPEEKTFGHHIDVPKEHSKDEEFIKNLAKDFIPIELNDAIIDFKQIKEGLNKKIVTFNFVAIQKNIVNSLINALKDEGLNVVGVDVNKNSIIRYCNNRFNSNEGSFAIVNIELEKSTISIANPSGHSHNLSAQIGGEEFDNKIKEILNISSTEELHNLIFASKHNESLIKPEDRSNIRSQLNNEFELIIQKTKDLIRAISSQEDIDLQTIYLIGCHSCVPGLKETFQETFPDINIKQDLEYIKLDETTELFYPKAIGLAIRGTLIEEYENEINLLPNERKEEIETAQLLPMVMRYSLLVYLIVIVFMLFAGISITESYLEHKITKQEAILYEEQTKNPYLKQVAQATQQKIQLESQINKILADTIPVSRVMRKIDDYNVNGISLININYSMNKANEHIMRLRGKVANRELTEELIVELEEEAFFREVDSPLSNLVGKGDRFVNMDLILDPEAIIANYSNSKKQMEEEVESSSKPKILAPKPASEEASEPTDGSENIENEQ
ncbi:pilus assembly protein PilM [Patescibacteria group bacterium]|nr:pilus assembly protein PilM [Patescibacteria group bacterium]